jgi:hypothetical protein
VLELIYGYAHFDSLGVLDPAQHLLVDGALLNQLHQGVQKELVGIGALLLVGLELLLELSRNRDLLRLQEAFQQHIDGAVDIVRSHIVTQVNFSMRLRHSQNTLNVTDCDGNTSDDVGLSTDVRIELRHFLLVNF